MSARSTIMGLVETALKTLKKSASFNLNLGSNVIGWPTTPVEQMQTPALLYFDQRASVSTTAEDGGSVPFGKHEHTLNVEVAAIVNTVADARLALEDVVSLFWTNKTWGGNARWTTLVSHQIEQQQSDRRIVMASMTFSITYRTDLGAI